MLVMKPMNNDHAAQEEGGGKNEINHRNSCHCEEGNA
jgi:hypothetical protein